MKILLSFGEMYGKMVGRNKWKPRWEEIFAMKNRRKRVLVFAAGLALALSIAGCSGKKESSGAGAGAGSSGSEDGGTRQAENEIGSLKSFEAETLDGGTFTQEDIASKDVTIINFWSLTCGPCIEEMPDIAEFAKTLPDHIQLITVCLDGGGNAENAESILKEAGFEGTTLIAGTGDIRKLCGNIQYTPTTLVVDKDGNIIGEEIIGRREDLADVYTEAVNLALKGMGKAEIGDGEE